MEEIFKKSTICFVDEEDYKKFKESCSPECKDFCGWEIRKEYDLIGFNWELKEKEGFSFKKTFDMLKIVP